MAMSMFTCSINIVVYTLMINQFISNFLPVAGLSADETRNSTRTLDDDLKYIGIVLILCALVCLGTWPFLLRLCTIHPCKNQSVLDDDVKISNSNNYQHSKAENTISGGDHHLNLMSLESLSQIKEIFGQDRHPCHVYLDYAIAYVIFSVAIPLLISFFEQRHSTNNDNSSNQMNVVNTVIKHHQIPLVIIAMLGGSLLALGNLTTQWSTTAFGAPLTTVLALQGSTCVVVGTYWNYTLQPDKTSCDMCLLAGVAMFLCAIVGSTLAQKWYKSATTTAAAHSTISSEDVMDENGGVELKATSAPNKDIDGDTETAITIASSNISTPEWGNYRRADSDAGISLTEISPQNHVKVSLSSSSLYKSYGSRIFTSQDSSRDYYISLKTDTEIIDNTTSSSSAMANDDKPKVISMELTTNITSDEDNTTDSSHQNKTGIAIAFFGGLCFGFFSPCFNISVNDPFHWSSSSSSLDDDNNVSGDDGGGISVPISNACFAIAFTLSSICYNSYLMTHPPSSASSIPSSTLSLYYQTPLSERRLAIASGVLCALGNVLQFQGGALAGFAVADIVQAFPLVATFWDVVVFGEFSEVLRWRVRMALVVMYVAYICGIGLLIASVV